MMKRKVHVRLFCAILTVILLFSTLALPTTAVTLDESVNSEAPLQPEIVETAPPAAEIIESEENPYLKAGDLTFEELQTATLAAADIPEMISAAKVEQKQHVNRLRAQETGLNSILFQNRNGSKTEYIFGSPVKYVAEDGSIRDIRTQPVAGQYAFANKTYTYAVTEHSMLQYFPAQIGTGILLEIDGHYVEMTPAPTQISMSIKAAELRGRSVLYENVFASGIDVKYTPTTDGIKEDILLEAYTGISSFSFLLKTDGLAIVERGGGFCFVGADDATRATLGEVIVYDSVGHSSAGSMTVEEIAAYATYRVTLHADEAFLKSPDTVYPVTVDPRIFEEEYISSVGYVNNILDYGLYNGSIPSNSDSYHSLGKLSNGTVGRVLYKLPIFQVNGCANSVNYTRYTREQIGSVTLNVYGSGSLAGSFKAYPITQNWATETNAFANDDLWDACTASTQYATVATTALNGYITVDITDIVREWADFNHGDTGALNPARGIALVNDNELTTSGRWSLYTTENTQNNVYVEFDYSISAGTELYLVNRSTGKFLRGIRTSAAPPTAITYDGSENILWTVEYVGNGNHIIKNFAGRPIYVTSNTLRSGAAPSTWTDSYYWQMTTSPYGGMIIKNVATNLVLYHDGAASAVSVVTAKSTSDADYWNTCWGVTDTYAPLEDFEIPQELLHYDYNDAVATIQMSLVLEGGEDDWTSNRDFTWSVSNPDFSITSSYSSSGLLTTHRYGGVTNIIVTHKTTGISKSFRFVCSVLREDAYYLIGNKETEKYMSISAPILQDGSLLEQVDLHTEEQAQFYVRMSGPSTYYIRSVRSDKYLQVQNASTSSGAKIEQGAYNADVSERWVITKTDSGAFRISPAITHSQGYAVAVPSGSNQSGTDLVQQAYTADTNYYDEWFFTRLLPMSGFERNYEPDSWNNEAASSYTNCYAYMLNVQYMPTSSEVVYAPKPMYPGEFGDEAIQKHEITANEVIRRVQADAEILGFTFTPIGKYEKCPTGTYKVALLVDSYKDYHWYRQDGNCFWSSQHGVGGSIDNKDGSDKIIADPEFANNSYYIDGELVDYVLVEFFAVSPLNLTREYLAHEGITLSPIPIY